jgi:D-3-phosphoglycerate dehydrogenase
VLIVEPLDPDVLDWLSARHAVVYAPHLAHDPRGLRGAGPGAALVIPPSVALDAALLRSAPVLLAVGRLSAGAENIDLEACALAGIEVVRPSDRQRARRGRVRGRRPAADARRVPVVAAEGCWWGASWAARWSGWSACAGGQAAGAAAVRLRLARGRLRPGRAHAATPCGAAGASSPCRCAS